MFELTKEFSFHAAHSLKFLPVSHKCARLHGHTYRILFTVAGDIDPQKGWVVDFGEMGKAAQEMYELLDHHFLNELEEITEPTAELIAKFVFDRLQTKFPSLVRVTVYETQTSSCTYSPFDTLVKVRVGPEVFSSAHVVVNPQFEEALHGHDFEVWAGCEVALKKGFEAREALEQALKIVVKELDHKTFLPKEQVNFMDNNVQYQWKGRTLHLKKDDVILIRGHSTAEGIAQYVASRITTYLDMPCPFLRITLREEPGTLVEYSATS